MEGSSPLPLAGHQVHPLQRAALCLKGTRPLEGWLSEVVPQPPPCPQSESGWGALKRARRGPPAGSPGRHTPGAGSAPNWPWDLGK